RSSKLNSPTCQSSEKRPRGVVCCVVLALLVSIALSSIALGDEPSAAPARTLSGALSDGPEHWTSPEGLHSSLEVMLVLAVVSLVPAVLLMTTSFVRIIVVLGLLRQAL